MASGVAVLFGDRIRSQTKPFSYLFQLVAAKDPVYELHLAIIVSVSYCHCPFPPNKKATPTAIPLPTCTSICSCNPSLLDMMSMRRQPDLAAVLRYHASHVSSESKIPTCHFWIG